MIESVFSIVIPLFIAALIAISLSLFGWRSRPAPGSIPFILLMLAVAEWAIAYAIELESTQFATKIFWDKLEFIGIVIVPAAWLILVQSYLGQTDKLKLYRFAVLALEPLAMLGIVWSKQYHGLIWNKIGMGIGSGIPQLLQIPGPGFWIHTCYSYLLLILGIILLSKALYTKPKFYRKQIITLIVSVAIPFVVNCLSNFGLTPFPGFDYTPFSFVLTGLVSAWGLFRFQLLNIVPVARETIIENMQDSVIILDRNNRIVDLNPAAQKLIQGSLAQAIGQPIKQVTSEWNEILEYPNERRKTTAEIALGEGKQQRYYDLQISILTNRRGQSTGRLIVARDVTEHKWSEALRESEERYRTLVESVGDGISIIRQDGQFLLVNEVAAALWGGLSPVTSGGTIWETLPREAAEKEMAVIGQVIRSGQSHVAETTMFLENRPRDIQVTIQPLQHENALIIMSDITNRKQAEAELLKDQKLASIAILAGGIAHDFNNILASIMASNQLIGITLNAGKDPLKYLNNIKTGVEKAAGLTQQLLAFSKDGMPIRKPADVAELIKENIALVLQGSDIICNCNIPQNLWTVNIDAGQISQVINNLILNATEAMPEGGLMEINLQNLTVETEGYGVLPPGKYLKITVKDQGSGISKENLPKIFDPYFTTKPKGTGLGLAISYSIIKKHDGYFFVNSTPNVGTSFEICLPALVAAPVQPGAPVSVTPGVGKILLRNDKEVIYSGDGGISKNQSNSSQRDRDHVH